MKTKELIDYLEGRFPLYLQESYDNCGLQIGDIDQDVSGILVALDCTEAVIDEAISLHYNTIITHHPLLFKGIKRIGKSTSIERIIRKCIKHDVVLYALHTNLDNHGEGVNKRICEKLGIFQPRPLVPYRGNLYKLVVFTPQDAVDSLHKALGDAGAGGIGNYYDCGFHSPGIGLFTPNEQATPSLGTAHVPERVEEMKMEYLVPKNKLHQVLRAMHETHPYEEVAHDVLLLENADPTLGSGMVGELAVPMEEQAFLSFVKETFNASVIRTSPLLTRTISRVAVCGGSGSFLLGEALRQQADVFISSDFKYHEFFEAEGKLMIADIGHYESEQFTQDLLVEIIQEKFPTFAVRITEHNTNPINFH